MRAVDREYGRLVDALDYSRATGLVADSSEAMTGTQRHLFKRATDHVGADAVYFARDVPLVYFTRCEADPSREYVADLHRRTWNDGRVPLLFVISPREVRLYDAYALPTADSAELDEGDRLIQKLDTAADYLKELADFRRPQVATGVAWTSRPGYFNPNARCDRVLLRNLHDTREYLTRHGGLADSIVDHLLARTILIFYLEHRGVLTKSYYQEFAKGAEGVTDLFSSAATAYALFDDLAQRFNGDLLPVYPQERDSVKDTHVQFLRRFFEGEDVVSGQLSLWPLYDFSVIPVQLVSSIYETFLKKSKRTGSGIFYTPVAVVELLMNEVLPWPDSKTHDIDYPRVLDPACGSGIFLVEAYRRIVERWCVTNGTTRPGVDVLRDLLTQCIVGVDTEPEAIRLAAFSLHIAMLDYLDPKSIWRRVRFPRLVAEHPSDDANLYCADAFDQVLRVHDGSFDLVVGNPPWKRDNLPESAAEFCSALDAPIAAELAQAFAWLAVSRLTVNGTAALVLPAKWLFNQEGPDVAFRTAFFGRNCVTSVINLSALRHDHLFEDAVAPATIVVFGARDLACPNEILYCTPKSPREGATALELVIDSGEVKWLPRNVAETYDAAWKVFLWGNWRDLELVQRLGRNGRTLLDYLNDMASQGWTESRGFQPWDVERNRRLRRSPKLHADRSLARMDFVDAKDIDRYVVDDAAYGRKFGAANFLYTGKREVYRAPHILIKEGQRGGRFCAAFSDRDCTFRDTITGIAAPPEHAGKLKALVAYLNSSVASYFLFMTASTWGVERERVKKGEVYRLPATILETDATVSALSRWLDRRSAASGSEKQKRIEQQIDEHVSAVLKLSAHDRILVADTQEVVIPFFQSHGKKDRAVTTHDLHAYVDAFCSVLEPLYSQTGSHITSTIYEGRAPLTVVSFGLADTGSVRQSTVLEDPGILEHLDRALCEPQSLSIFVRRRLKVFAERKVYIVKPSKYRFWTRSAALQDADEVVAESLAGVRSGAS